MSLPQFVGPSHYELCVPSHSRYVGNLPSDLSSDLFATHGGLEIRPESVPDIGQPFSRRADQSIAKMPQLPVVVGKPYALNTRPETIDQRVREMGQALELAATKTSGTVQMK